MRRSAFCRGKRAPGHSRRRPRRLAGRRVEVLAEAGYVHTSKAPHGSRTRTWLTLNDAGRAALDGHLAESRRIAALATNL